MTVHITKLKSYSNPVSYDYKFELLDICSLKLNLSEYHCFLHRTNMNDLLHKLAEEYALEQGYRTIEVKLCD